MVKEGQLRVWWGRNFEQMEYHYVGTLEEAVRIYNMLADADLKNKKVTDNAGGLEICENGLWSEYYNDDGNAIDEIMKEDEEIGKNKV